MSKDEGLGKEGQCSELSNFGLHIVTACVVSRILPQDVNCPGGINAWNTVTFYINNHTCQGQRNLCNSTGDVGMPSHLHFSRNCLLYLVVSILNQKDSQVA